MGKPNAHVINDVKLFKKHIKQKYKVNRIILFGSQARGESKKWSDVDLIVISSKFKGKNALKGAQNLYGEWHRHLNIDRPVDFLCYSPEEFKRQKNRISIVKQAIDEGIEI